MKFYNNFMYEFKIEGGLFYEKNCQKYLMPQFEGQFGQIMVFANQPQVDRIKLF